MKIEITRVFFLREHESAISKAKKLSEFGFPATIRPGHDPEGCDCWMLEWKATKREHRMIETFLFF